MARLKAAHLVIIFIGLLLVSVSCQSAGKNTVDVKNPVTIGDKTRTYTNIKTETESYRIGDRGSVDLVLSKGTLPLSLFFLNLHDNENTSVEAALEIINRHGGALLEIRHSGERLISFAIGPDWFRFDPNRMFSKIGIEKDLSKHGADTPGARKAVADFSAKIVKDYIEANSKLIVTVHNNTNDGGLTVNSYRVAQGETLDVSVSPKEDPDDFFIVTERKYFDDLRALGFNVVLQNNEKIVSDDSLDDGSLSVFCGRRKIPYINVESEHGHLRQQVQMLEALTSIVSKNS